ncbi:hypothetical protein FOZ61_001096 [Perkinsus olseni]|uniref:Uncharacterized protein n=1 Tax=Perkinsus olseni TaxID=32597 RepID=A0A7J6LY00_PEROL|nr:hypothetical protein FOZ61_001096 [Perkinsus olseni]
MVSSTRLSYCTAALIFLAVPAAYKADGRRVMQQIKLEAPNLSQEVTDKRYAWYHSICLRTCTHLHCPSGTDATHVEPSVITFMNRFGKMLRRYGCLKARALHDVQLRGDLDPPEKSASIKRLSGISFRPGSFLNMRSSTSSTRSVDGENVLSGVGVNPPETLTLDGRAGGGGGSIQMGGQQWSRRLSAMCQQLVEEVGEYELVQRWATEGEDTPAVWLCNSYCAATDQSAVVPSRHEDDEITLKEFMRMTGFEDDTFTGKKTRQDWVRVIADFVRALNSDQSKASSRHADEL